MKKLLALLAAWLLFLPTYAYTEVSTCYGTTSNGWLEAGVRLPGNGANYESYSTLASLLGRTWVHSTVMEIVLSAYANLETEQPNKQFKYAETGFRQGGEFKPHKTHQNGLSVDFMVPVLNADDESVHLSTHLFNKFGYDIEFDENGNYNGLRIDFDALAIHIVQLHKETKKRGHDLWRVIFDPKLQPQLFKTKYADYLKENITFSSKRSWVRHDEHYHVDFSIPCNRKTGHQELVRE